MAVAVIAPTSEFALELHGGETDRANTDYLLVLEDALVATEDNPAFSSMAR